MQRVLTCLTLALALAAPAYADDSPAAKPADKTAEQDKPKEESKQSHGSVSVAGQSLKYTATAGTLIIRNDKDEAEASIFYVAYTLDGADAKKRPVTFLYNGGPGSASIWLHMGSVGPLRVVTSDAQPTPDAPYSLVPNEYSLLDRSDLVFVDAIGTGYSRAVGKAKDKDFWGVDQDGKAFAHFIERYLGKNSRWNSPKFLMGESYGTTRSAVVSNILTNDGVALNGIVLVSTLLDFATESFNVGNDLPYVTNLPTYAAVAWYHKKLKPMPSDLKSFLDEVRAFATGEYAHALMQGARLDAATRADVLEKLALYTGVDAVTYDRSNLRLGCFQFMKDLTRDEGHTVGRLDARFTGLDHDNAGEYPEFDPADAYITGAYTAALQSYLHDSFGYPTDREYLLQSNGANQDWDWKHSNGFNPWWPGSLDVAEDLRQAMSQNPHLKVFVASGYYDLATPFAGSEYTFDHIGLDKSLRGNVQFGYYESGHMIYLHVPALQALKADLGKFYDKTLAQ